MLELIQRTRDDIVAAIRDGTLVLPTLPEIALQVRDAAHDAEIDIATLTKVIQKDAALTAGVIRAANSALLRAPRPIDNLQMAVSRLGINGTANLATGLAMRQMFRSKSAAIDKRMREAWSHSAEISGIAHVIARHYTHLKPDEATLAGIVHRIGALPILRYAESHRALTEQPTFLDEVIEDLHPTLGRAVLQSWKFPVELVVVPVEYLRFDRTPPRADYADVIQVATLQAYAGTDHPFGAIDWSTVGAFGRVGMPTENTSLEVVDLTSDMKDAAALLG